jgi:hypothetical protein
MKMGRWHNFSRHKIYQCRVKKEFRILSVTHGNACTRPAEEANLMRFSAKGEVLKPLRQLTLLGLCPYKPRTLGHRKLAQAGLAVQKTKRCCK